MPTILRPASAARLLADFIAAPVGMLPQNHLALIGSLHSGQAARPLAPRAGLTPGTQTVSEWYTDDVAGPWHEPLWTLDATTGIALLEIKGPLIKGYDDFTAWYYECASIDRISRALDEIAVRSDIRALIVVLDTPGGVSTGMPELAAKLAALAGRILVVTHTSDCAASNGMRLAVAGLFLPTASAIVGCIGTYIALYDYTEQLKELGISLELYRAGKLKALTVVGKTRTEDERAFLQASVERCNTTFKDFVRSRCPAVEDSSMEGQWFDGDEAVGLGLAAGTVTGLPELLSKVLAQIRA